VYGLLRQLIGELSSFSEQFTVSGDAVDGSSELPKYYHLNLWQCFSRAQSVITALLDEITAGPEYVFSLVYDGTYYSSELPPAIFEGRNRFFLVVQTSADPKVVLNALATGAKLSSRENLPILIVRALPGAGIEHLDRPPQELPRRANALYFQIDITAISSQASSRAAILPCSGNQSLKTSKLSLWWWEGGRLCTSLKCSWILLPMWSTF
jgi:type VI secretion system protein ImpJ